MDDFSETRKFWDRVADDWQIQIGSTGDSNRTLNSDPVIWSFAGEVRGLRVLDAGCGTGYLANQLESRGAGVTGVDFSERMIAIAREQYPHIDFRVDSCSELASLQDAEIDLVIANYVLMDTPDLEGTMRAFSRVLKDRGAAILVFSHPCFPAGGATMPNSDETMYRWDFSYFERRKRVDPPWAHFKSDFIWFHRPLSDYWKAFKHAGFSVMEFEEPRITPDRFHLAQDAKKLRNSRTRPYSVAFHLQRNPRKSEAK